jgi:hypothetical protein
VIKTGHVAADSVLLFAIHAIPSKIKPGKIAHTHSQKLQKRRQKINITPLEL